MNNCDLSKLNFLIVEDSRFKLSLVRQQLRTFDAGEIFECLDGADAFETLSVKRVDFIITDSGMSPVDGLSLVHHIRTGAESPNAEVPIIILVENPSLSKLTAARDVGATDVLTKPVSPKMLYDRIQNAIKNSRNFVRAEKFVGPDRRRRKPGDRKEEERRRL